MTRADEHDIMFTLIRPLAYIVFVFTHTKCALDYVFFSLGQYQACRFIKFALMTEFEITDIKRCACVCFMCVLYVCVQCTDNNIVLHSVKLVGYREKKSALFQIVYFRSWFLPFFFFLRGGSRIFISRFFLMLSRAI